MKPMQVTQSKQMKLLQDLKQINGKNIKHLLHVSFEEAGKPFKENIIIDHDTNCVTFRLHEGSDVTYKDIQRLADYLRIKG